MSKRDNLIIENARLIFRNFAGEEDRFNRAGNRNFSVVIEDPDEAQRLIEDGWNLKLLKPRDPDDLPVHYLPVTVNMGGDFPAKLFLVNGRRRPVPLDEDMVSTLDYSELANVDLTISPYDWDVNGKTGRKAYLKDLYATQVENRLERKYNPDYDDGIVIDAKEYFIPRRR